VRFSIAIENNRDYKQMKTEIFYIERCRQLIETKLAWGNSGEWQNQDFENLSERIFEKTKVSLSSSTLKRIWGKVHYTGSPNISTLNALAQFLDYENWRAFTSNGLPPAINQETISLVKPKKTVAQTYWWLAITLFLGVLITFGAFFKISKVLTFEQIVFTSKPVTFGVPNTVIFNYDVTKSNADSVFIQQSWDIKRRYKVAKHLHEYASTYYTPGYFRAKLILNDSIVKEHDLLIESDGWLRTIDTKPQPIYLSKLSFEKNDILNITDDDLLKNKVDFNKELPWVSLFNVSKQRQYSSQSFEMETILRNTFKGKGGACKQIKIILFSTHGIIVLPLSIKGCVGELEMFIGEERISGKTTNLSAFGVNTDDWITVKCIIKNQRINILINNNIAYEGGLKHSLGQIVGSRISFLGAGEVKKFAMR
jgi:hypothetical protein